MRAVWPFRSLSGARGCARIDSRLDTAKICSDGRADVDHARLRAVSGKWKTFSHGLVPDGNAVLHVEIVSPHRITLSPLAQLIGENQILAHPYPEFFAFVGTDRTERVDAGAKPGISS